MRVLLSAIALVVAGCATPVAAQTSIETERADDGHATQSASCAAAGDDCHRNILGTAIAARDAAQEARFYAKQTADALGGLEALRNDVHAIREGLGDTFVLDVEAFQWLCQSGFSSGAEQNSGFRSLTSVNAFNRNACYVGGQQTLGGMANLALDCAWFGAQNVGAVVLRNRIMQIVCRRVPHD